MLSTTWPLRLRVEQALRYLKMAGRSLHPKWNRTESRTHAGRLHRARVLGEALE